MSVIGEVLTYAPLVAGGAGIVFAFHRLRDPVRSEQRSYRTNLCDALLAVRLDVEDAVSKIDLLEDVPNEPPSIEQARKKLKELRHKLNYPDQAEFSQLALLLTTISGSWYLMDYQVERAAGEDADPTGRERASAEKHFKQIAEELLPPLRFKIADLERRTRSMWR